MNKILQAAIDRDDFELVKQAIDEGAQPQSLFIYAIRGLSSPKILQLLLENGFNIHAENNMILREWMGSSPIGGGEKWTSTQYELLACIFNYYLDRPDSIEKFNSLRVSDKKRLFLIGLYSNNFTMMKFAIMIGADKNEALNTAHRQYKSYKEGDIGSIYSTIYKDNNLGVVDYKIIEYILNSDIKLNKMSISRAVCFEFMDIVNAIKEKADLEYAYEVAYSYEKEDLCQYFIDKGVSAYAQNIAKMRVSAIKGDIKELRSALNNGADIDALDRETLVELIYKNQAQTLRLLCEAGVIIDSSLNSYLNEAITRHKAYESVAFLIEQGFDITAIKTLPLEFKKAYPAFADMKEKRFKNIFEYTLYLARDIYPALEGKEKEEILKRVAQLSALVYVKKMSEERFNEE